MPRIGDPTAQNLLAELDERLRWGGVFQENELRVLIFANRSMLSAALARHDPLAAVRQAKRLQTAFSSCQQALLERFSKRALIRTERLGRLTLNQVDSGFRQTPEERADGILSLARPIEHSGGLYVDNDAALQEQLCEANQGELGRQLDVDVIRSSGSTHSHSCTGVVGSMVLSWPNPSPLRTLTRVEKGARSKQAMCRRWSRLYLSSMKLLRIDRVSAYRRHDRQRANEPACDRRRAC